MTESDDDGVRWDETVDIVCMGTSPGVLAYAICCAENDLDVLLVHPPAEPDANTAEWIAAMTNDLNPGPGPDTDGVRPAFSLAEVSPMPDPPAKRAMLEPFVGERLRQWSAHCLQSPFGVMFTQIPELLVPMHTADGESITAALLGDFPGDRAADDLVAWLWDCARELGVAETKNHMAAMLLEGGRAAGIELDDGYLLATSGGFALPVIPQASRPDLPDVSGDKCAVAIVGRPAGRFATVDLLVR